MKQISAKLLRCPNCKSLVGIKKTLFKNRNILYGKLICKNKKCKKTYNISSGLADLSVLKYSTENDTINSFGYEWKAHLEQRIEKNKVFGRTLSEDLKYFFQATKLTSTDIKGKLILDVGCGSGKLTNQLAKFSPKYIFGIDIHSGLDKVYESCHIVSNYEIIKADVFNLPFHKDLFDIVWCNGVIHHTPDPYLAFQNLTKVVKPGGLLYVWVYEKRFSPYKFTKNIFRFTRLDHLPYTILFKICQLFSIWSVGIHGIYRFSIILLYPFLRKSTYFKKTIRNRSYSEFLMTWFDALSPRYDYRFSKKDIIRWFKDNGFTDLKFYHDQIGISGRNLSLY